MDSIDLHNKYEKEFAGLSCSVTRLVKKLLQEGHGNDRDAIFKAVHTAVGIGFYDAEVEDALGEPNA